MKILISCFLLFCMLAAQAAIHWVGPGMCIQTAVDTAAALDTILLQVGSYEETVIPYGKPLTIASHFLLYPDTNYIANTIVRPGTARPDTTSCFVYGYGEPPGNRLVGLTLRDGTGTWSDLSPSHNGGGIWACSSSVSIENCRITQCTAEANGGGIFALDAPGLMRFELQVVDCRFDSCSSGVFGGGISLHSGRISIRRCSFCAAAAGLWGGGGIVNDCEGDIDSCSFVRCAAWTEGGLSLAGGRGNLTNCLFDSNGTVGSLDYGHLSVVDKEGVVANCIFRHNLTRGPSLLWEVHGEESIRFVHNVVEDNSAQDFQGTMYVWYPHGGEIAYNVFRNNHNQGLPVIQVAGAGTTIRIHHNVFENNTCLDTSMASVAATQVEPCMSLDSNWIAGNSYKVVDRVYQMNPCVIDARNNWWGHPSGPYEPVRNPSGQGDTLLCDSVLFIPWLTEPPDSTMPDDYLSVKEPPEVSATWVLMNAYPNPFNQSVTLVLAGFAGDDFEIGLYNLLGQMVDVVHRGALTGGQVIYQAPPHLASGVYLLSAHDRHGVQTKKVVLLK